MKINLRQSRVAHRLMILLLISALLPIVLLAIPSFNFVTQKLFTQLQLRLEQSSEQLGLAIEERLDFIATELSIIASDPELNLYKQSLDENPKLKKRLKRWFKGLSITRPSERPQHILDPIEPLPQLTNNYFHRLNDGKPMLIVENISQKPTIYILQLLVPKQPNSGIIMGKINPDQLWQLNESIEPKTDGCILNNDLIPIICTKSIDTKNLSAISDKLLYTKKGHVQVQINDDSFIQAYWSDFDEESLLPPEWIVLTLAPLSLALNPIGNFAIIFPLFLILATLLVLVLSIRQIRRVVIPLEKLREGTKKIANKEFNDPVSIQSGDEFEELAKSFNIMSSRLGKQFNALETMAHIDRMILSTFDMKNIIETIIARMRHAVPCDNVSILILNDNNPNKAILYHRETQLSGDVEYNDVSIHEDDYNLFAKHKKSLFLDAMDIKPKFLTMHGTTSSNFLCLPIYLDEKLSSIIILSYEKEPNYTQEDLKQARDLADRVAVALSNAAWEEKLYKNAHYDNLTELPNRLLFQDRIHHALKRADREKTCVALMFVDLDHFKSLNDTLGHAAGDDYLVETAKRLRSSVRNVDTIARLGGDEFTVIIPDLQFNEETIADVSAIASKILRKTSLPFNTNGQDVMLSVSIGIALYPNDASSYADLLKAADSALYYAKGKGKSNYQFYSEDIDAEAKSLIQLENNLKEALKQNEFELFYQPRINIHTQKIVGAEALIRWRTKDNDIISPGKFIPIVEDNGMILTLGKWIIEQAASTCRQWHDMGFNELVIAMNLSAHQFRDENIVDLIENTLAKVKIHPNSIELEITESTLMTDMENAIRVLNQFRLMGIQIAVDDFGTGYSSLNYLKKFPVDILKIDQSFIKNIHQDRDNAAIVSAIITLANNLDLGVIAEGVETLEELNKLKSQSCQEVQGYVYSKPLTSIEFIHYLTEHRHKPPVPSPYQRPAQHT